MDWQSLNWVDIAMLGAVVLSAMVGFTRGITYELMSLAGWFVAYFAGRWLAPLISPYVSREGTTLNHVASFACAFFVVLILWSLAAKAVAALISATPLRPIDRAVGGAFGLVRGGVLLLVVTTIVVFTPYVHAREWRQSVVAVAVESVLRELLPLLPDDAGVPARVI